MSKKIMLLALAALSAALFVVPATSSAAELHLDNVTSFTGTGGNGSLAASGGLPTITCESNHSSGSVESGGTTGTMSLHFTGCHINVVGFTVACKSAGAPAGNTISTGGTFHLITTTDGPAVLVTMNETTLECAGTIIHVHGSVIGTITSPSCGGSSNNLTLNFAASGSEQAHKTYTGNTYDLTVTRTTPANDIGTGALTQEATLSSATTGTLTCT